MLYLDTSSSQQNHVLFLARQQTRTAHFTTHTIFWPMSIIAHKIIFIKVPRLKTFFSFLLEQHDEQDAKSKDGFDQENIDQRK